MKKIKFSNLFKKICDKKYILPIVLIATVIACFSYSTFALIKAQTEVIDNQFKLQTTGIKIVEEFEDGDSVKKNVCVQNTGEATMYVRIALVEELTNKSGLIIPNVSGESYFTYENLTGTDWITGDDGYYYYSKQLKENELTQVLFTKAQPAYQVKKTEKLSLYVMAEAIQVKGIEKWTNVTKNPDGTLGGGE